MDPGRGHRRSGDPGGEGRLAPRIPARARTVRMTSRAAILVAVAFVLYGLLSAACVMMGFGTKCRIPWRLIHPTALEAAERHGQLG